MTHTPRYMTNKFSSYMNFCSGKNVNAFEISNQVLKSDDVIKPQKQLLLNCTKAHYFIFLIQN